MRIGRADPSRSFSRVTARCHFANSVRNSSTHTQASGNILREENSSLPSLAPPTAAEEYCAVAALERANHEEKRKCKAGGPSRIRQIGERSPKRRQEDGRVRLLRILRERKARPSRFPCRRQQMANRSWLASSRRSIERLRPPRHSEAVLFLGYLLSEVSDECLGFAWQRSIRKAECAP